MREIDAVESLVALLETMEDRPTTIYENQEIPARKPFLIFDTVPIGSRTVANKNQSVTEGAVQITVVTQGGTGTVEAEQIARRIAAVFTLPPGANYQGVRIENPPSLDKGYADAGLWRLPVKIRWRVLPE